jgi:hypothetical protein
MERQDNVVDDTIMENGLAPPPSAYDGDDDDDDELVGNGLATSFDATTQFDHFKTSIYFVVEFDT